MIDHEQYRLGRGQAGRALRRVVTRVVCLLMLEVATRLTPVLGQEGSTQPRAIIFRSATFHGCFSSTPRFDLWPKR